MSFIKDGINVFDAERFEVERVDSTCVRGERIGLGGCWAKWFGAGGVGVKPFDSGTLQVNHVLATVPEG